MENVEETKHVASEIEEEAIRRARDRANIAKWDLNIAVFLFAVLIIVIILLFQGIRIEIVAPVAVVGLGLVWLSGWRRGKQLFQRFHDEELFRLDRELKQAVKDTVGEAIEETVEEKVQKALRDRWK